MVPVVKLTKDVDWVLGCTTFLPAGSEDWLVLLGHLGLDGRCLTKVGDPDRFRPIDEVIADFKSDGEGVVDYRYIEFHDRRIDVDVDAVWVHVNEMPLVDASLMLAELYVTAACEEDRQSVLTALKYVINKM